MNLEQITKDIFALQETFLKIAQESFNRGVKEGMKNRGHDFWDNVDQAYESEKTIS